MKAKPLPSREYLQERLSYNWFTGIIKWKPRKEITPYHIMWNKRCAGKEAGTIIHKDGYRAIILDDISYLVHRLSWVMLYNDDPGELVVDHKDRNPTNNKYWNLRAITQDQNMINRKIHKNNKSGITGVCWAKEDKRWLAVINNKILGRFIDIEDAIKLRKEAEQIYHKEFAPT